jgi:pimeloyl-ACP methyl ester carboxylesterase
LRAYIAHGFARLDDGRVRLKCTPEIESAVLLPILEAMEQVYTGDARGNPFGWLSGIKCPVRIATTEKSWPIYKQMASRAIALLPAASEMKFDGVGHNVAQEAPELVLRALRAFAAQVR